MISVNVKGHTIEFFDNIKDLPIKRYQQSNKHLMIASDIGSDFFDFDKRTVEITEFLKKGMVAEAIKSLENRRQNVWNAYENYNPKGMALAIMVYSIDGIVMADYSDNGLEKTLERLNEIGYTHQAMTENMSEVKKKSIFNLKHTFRKLSKTMAIWFTKHSFSKNAVPN